MAGTRLGLIADTHGLLRPEALDALRGVERILHAGDVGREEVLLALERIAPVTAVRGNVDRGVWASSLPETAEIEVEGRSIHVLHILEDLALDPRAAGFDAVIYGHSHQPEISERGGVLYVNPGSAGPRRFKLPVSVAFLEIGPAGVRAEILELAPGRI